MTESSDNLNLLKLGSQGGNAVLPVISFNGMFLNVRILNGINTALKRVLCFQERHAYEFF